jgi:hypothetical protein
MQKRPEPVLQICKKGSVIKTQRRGSEDFPGRSGENVKKSAPAVITAGRALLGQAAV